MVEPESEVDAAPLVEDDPVLLVYELDSDLLVADLAGITQPSAGPGHGKGRSTGSG